jgi:AraC-like DNA-binding protein
MIDPAEIIEEATSLLHEQVRSRSRPRARASGGLLAWQMRKVRSHVDLHISGRVLVADLSAIVQLSEGHFSRAFKRTFGIAPHAFVLRRRLELAARLMVESSASLSDISLRCGSRIRRPLQSVQKQVMGEPCGVASRARAATGSPIPSTWRGYTLRPRRVPSLSRIFLA